MADQRRVYYDHEPMYKRILAKGGRGWDDAGPVPTTDSYVALERFLASPLAPPRGTRALELGCGGGQATLILARQGYVAAGVDFSESAIALARTNAAQAQLEAHFEVDDCLTLKTQKTGSLGLVVDNHVLHCIVKSADRAAFFAQVKRVLAPGGLFFSDTMSCEGDFQAERFKADPVTRVALNETRIWVSEAELDRELATAGFEVVDGRRRRDPGDPPGTGLCLERVARVRA